MAKKTVIIGGVAGGATTAARLRRRDESMEIVVLEKGDYISFANCGLPYYIGDVIKSREALLLQTPEAMKKKFNVDVRTASQVTAICPQENQIQIKNLNTGETYEESYDNLVIATGSSPIRPSIPGIAGEGIFTLWNIPDTDRIKSYLEEKKPARAAVIGGGFIGMEMAENLTKEGLQVTVVEMQDQVMAPLDYEMAQLLHENIRDNQVGLILKDRVCGFVREEGETVINLSSGRQIRTDMVILSLGVRPNSDLAKEAGLELNGRGGIQVNEFMQTSMPNIYAVGDAVETKQFVTGEKTMIPLAGPANKQARICADCIAGDRKAYEGTMGTSIAQIFDLSAASVGLNEKQLKASGKEKGKDYETIIINQKSHAGYYPDALPLMLKLIFTKERKILGAQIVGGDGVDKRIDTIATVMRLGGTTDDLTKLELAYAPPFSSAKDPVNMLGFTAENVLKGMVSFISVRELDACLEEKEQKKRMTILDVTEAAERQVFSIPGSYHIPLGELRERIGELDQEQLLVVYCAVGVRSYTGARILMQSGFSNVKVLEGGTSLYKSFHHKITASQSPVRENMKSGIHEEEKMEKREQRIQSLDCCGMQCPGPIMKVNETLKTMDQGDILNIQATDMGFARDMETWCERTGNTLVKKERQGHQHIVTIRKGAGSSQTEVSACSQAAMPQGKTIIVFDGDFDKVLASFIIANGAASMGREVTMFFTFWGLNALRRTEKVKVKKPFMDRMFGAMMPRGSKKLRLSKMNMAGMGTKMMKKVMKDKNVNSLEDLMKQAMVSGIHLVACTMSMDVMGITKEELIDGVEYAGVASYLGDAENANVNLFV